MVKLTIRKWKTGQGNVQVRPKKQINKKRHKILQCKSKNDYIQNPKKRKFTFSQEQLLSPSHLGPGGCHILQICIKCIYFGSFYQIFHQIYLRETGDKWMEQPWSVKSLHRSVNLRSGSWLAQYSDTVSSSNNESHIKPLNCSSYDNKHVKDVNFRCPHQWKSQRSLVTDYYVCHLLTSVPWCL